jgi:hypothetical protein
MRAHERAVVALSALVRKPVRHGRSNTTTNKKKERKKGQENRKREKSHA